MKSFVNPVSLAETEVDITQERIFDGGTFGDVYEAVAVVRKDIRGAVKEHSRKVVLKRFKENCCGSAGQNTNNAVVNYVFAKKIGLKVFLTYRVNKADNEILMTNGNNDSWICLGLNNNINQLAKLGEPPMKEITNLDCFLKSVAEQTVLASKNKIRIPSDSCFMLVERESRKKIDFVFGDVDRLNPVADKSVFENFLMCSNSYAMEFMVDIFLNKNVIEEKRGLYLAEKRQVFEKLRGFAQ